MGWSQDEYLETSAIRPPSEFYGDKIWAYIRARGLDCQNLSQVAKLGRIKAENFPFVPATLTTKIDEVRGLAAAPPADQAQSVTVNIVTETGAVVGTYASPIAELWGKKLPLTFPVFGSGARTVSAQIILPLCAGAFAPLLVRRVRSHCFWQFPTAGWPMGATLCVTGPWLP